MCCLFAAIPKTLSYQAVVRDGSGNLITEKSIGVSISILLEDTSNVVYQEQHVVATNKNGLMSLSIGKESSFSEIDWSDGTYFIQCQFDLNKDGFYELESCSPMQSVPYALYAENISPSALPEWVYREEKPSYSYDELEDKPFIPSRLSELEDDVVLLTINDLPKQDSSFYKSVASHITSADTLRWNEKLSEERDPIYSASVASHISSADTLRWNEKLSEERDPIYSASVASHITSADTLRWNEKLSEEIDPIYSASVASHISSADTLRWNEKLSEERDPIYSASIASHITSADTLRWNEKLSEERDPIYSASVASHITSADTLRWNEKLSEESDPIYGQSVASQITAEDTMNWNEKLGRSDLEEYVRKDELPEFEPITNYVTHEEFDEVRTLINTLSQRVEELNNSNLQLQADNLKLSVGIDSLKNDNQDLRKQIQLLLYGKIYDYSRTTNPSYSYSLTSWNEASDIYRNMKEGDRIVFLVRHSERNDDCEGVYCDLNDNGVELAEEAGKKFKGGLAGVNDSYYGSTSVERCKTTSYLIATNRGDTYLNSKEDVVNPIDEIYAKYYGEGLHSWPGRAEYCNENMKEAEETSLEIVNKLLNLSKGKTFAWFTSHDYLLVPLVEWATNLGIDFEKYRGTYSGQDSKYDGKETDYFYWCNFMSGVAILVHPDNTFEIYPVKNLEDGFRYNRCYKDW